MKQLTELVLALGLVAGGLSPAYGQSLHAATESIKDAELSCAGTLEKDDTVVRKVTGSVHITGGTDSAYVMVMVTPEGIPMGVITGPLLDAKPNYLRFTVATSTFRIRNLEPQIVGIDRVNAQVLIIIADPKLEDAYHLWLNCTVRKPQF
jgi:hypothetical protein